LAAQSLTHRRSGRADEFRTPGTGRRWRNWSEYYVIDSVSSKVQGIDGATHPYVEYLCANRDTGINFRIGRVVSDRPLM